MKVLTLAVCLSLSLCSVRCEEQSAELSVNTDLKKLSAIESKITESASESKSKDGDTLDASPSLQNPQQTDYSYVVSKQNQPLSVDLGPYQSGQLAPQQYGDSQSSVATKPQSIVYRYTTNADGSVGPSADSQPQQHQQSYIRTEPQHSVFEQSSYIRQPQMQQMDDVPKHSQSSSAGYQLPRTAPGVSTTFSSPEVKIVSHTRQFLPVVYNKPSEDSSSGSGQQSNSEQEYDKAVQDRPGGSYGPMEQPDDGYENVDQNEDQEREPERPQREPQREQQQQQRGPSQSSYENQNSFRPTEDRLPAGVGEVLSRGPFYNIHKPFAAHVQVIEDKDEYKNEEKEDQRGNSYDRQQSYGLRTQPRQQFKNYKPSGYQPGMMSAYDPPSPPMSQFLPPVPPQQNSQSDSEADDEESYNNRDLNARPQRLPEPQSLRQHQQRAPAGVEIEFDQGNHNDPHVVRGPEGYRKPESYGPGPDQSNAQQYEQERPEPQDYDNNNHLGPKYNVEGDEPEQRPHFQRGRPQIQQQQQQLIKPQEIEYGFIPLSEAKEILGPFRGPKDENRGPQRPRLQERPNGFGPEGYREQRGPGLHGPGQRRPPQFNTEGMVSMYGRGQQGEGHRPQRPQFNNNDYREQPMGQIGGPYRKPQFERPQFPKNGGQENNAFGMGELPSNEEEEVAIDEEEDYGKQNKTNGRTSGEDSSVGPYDPDKLPYECFPWNCNPWYAIHPNSPYNSPIGVPLKGRGPHTHIHPNAGSGLPPGASYNPRDVGLDDSVIAQLNLAASSPQGLTPGGIPASMSAQGFRGTMAMHGSAPGLDIPFSGSRPFPGVAAPGMPKPRPVPYSATGQGFRSQYGYRAAAASELSPVSAAQSQVQGSASSPIANLLNLNPVKSFRSLMSYITGGING